MQRLVTHAEHEAVAVHIEERQLLRQHLVVDVSGRTDLCTTKGGGSETVGYFGREGLTSTRSLGW